MRQAILTRFLGPTDRRASRVKASAEAGSRTIAWDHRLGIEENHARAAEMLALKLGWSGTWHGGGMPGSGYCFVQMPLDAELAAFQIIIMPIAA